MIVVPEKKSPASEARKAISHAISSSVPRRPIGTVLGTAVDHLGRVLRPQRLGVELAGGDRAERIPKRAHSTESVRIMFSTAARPAPEWTIPGIPLWGERVTLSTLPPPLRDERLGRRGVGHQPGADAR